MEQTVHVQQCLHTANALHEMLLTAHANANRGMQMAIDEQNALMQLQVAAGTMRGLVNVRCLTHHHASRTHRRVSHSHA